MKRRSSENSIDDQIGNRAEPPPSEGVRLQKYMADCGVASRRKCEELIADGRVRVNSQVVRTLGTRIIPGLDKVTLNNVAVTPRGNASLYYVLHKPPGYLVSASDPQGRRTIYDLLKGIPGRVVPVGRLDLDSEGLLILTNDGQLAFRLMHPRYRVEKEYEIWIDGKITRAEIKKLESGVTIEGGLTQPARVRFIGSTDTRTRLSITITEGKKRQVRLMLEAVGHPVKRLRRIREGDVTLGRLPAGKFRALIPEEVEGLKREVGLIIPSESEAR